MRIGNTLAHLGNTRASMHVVVAKPSFISTAYGLWRVMGYVMAPELP
jgi:hypothetical protein